jgi:hypothetical protein
MFTIATRILAASTAGIVSGVAAIWMIFASPAPNQMKPDCSKVRCLAPGFQA